MGSYLPEQMVGDMEPMLVAATKIYQSYSQRVLTFITDI